MRLMESEEKVAKPCWKISDSGSAQKNIPQVGQTMLKC